MATYSSAQAYVSTTRYSRTSAVAVGSTADQVIYTVPAQREAVVEVQLLSWATGDLNTRFKISFSGGGEQSLVNKGVFGSYVESSSVSKGETAPTQLGMPSNFPMKFTLAAGESIVFSPVSTLAAYQYNILVKEFIAA
jgi:hypothetical protein